ncbi:MAG: glycosyltransferase family 4 protein [Flavobacteriales bacterium]
MNGPTGVHDGARKRVLVLYLELAPYVLACLNALVTDHPVEVHLVRWPVNREAPFELAFHPHVKVYDRHELDDRALMELARKVNPHLVLASGWVDKGYLRVCRAMRAEQVATVMTFDTAWRGDAKQWISTVGARFWVRRTFSHAWATGSRQAEYAARLGFGQDHIRTGFYAADTVPFIAAYERTRKARRMLPHRFVCVARYIPTKGQQELCDAFARLCDEGRAGDWDLWLVGTGELHEKVKNSASGRHERIHHQGFVQAERVPVLLDRCGVAVLPSLYEPWGVAVQEFACAGLPLLLSDAVGARERFLREGQNGFVHRAGDVEDLYRSLAALIALPDDHLLAMSARSADLGKAWQPKDWAHVAVELLHHRA